MKKIHTLRLEKKVLSAFVNGQRRQIQLCPAAKACTVTGLGLRRVHLCLISVQHFSFLKALNDTSYLHILSNYVHMSSIRSSPGLGGPFSASFYPHLHCPSSGHVHTVLDCLHLQTIWGVLFLWCFPSWSSQRTSTCPSLGPYLSPVSSSVSLSLRTTVSSSTPVPSVVPTLKWMFCVRVKWILAKHTRV